MNISLWGGLLAVLLAVIGSAEAADNLTIERLAMCQDSWLDWKDGDPARIKTFSDSFQRDFLRKANDAFFVPKSSQTVAGLPVTQVYPESVGMGVGFSVMVGANFEQTKKRLEQKIGKPLNKCEPPSDNMRTCELTIGPKKTLLLVAEENPKSTTTLFGCYYFYAK